jgi:hypothetical protein
MYFDYFSEESNDIHFVRRALFHLFQREEVRLLQLEDIFSDGGPKHFRNRRAVGFVLVELNVVLQLAYRIVWHFFAPNHGKNGCDSRAAVVKTFLRRLAVRGVQSRGVTEIVANITSERRQNLTDRRAVELPYISHASDYDWSEMAGIKGFSSLQWTGNTKNTVLANGTPATSYEIVCRALSNDDSRDATLVSIAPMYEFDRASKGAILDVSKEVRNNERRIHTKHSARVQRISAAPAAPSDDESSEELAEVRQRHGIVDEKELKRAHREKNYNTPGRAVAVREQLDGENYVWRQGKVLRAERKKVGEERSGGRWSKTPIYQYSWIVEVRITESHIEEREIFSVEDLRLIKE